jgi:Rad3-related DNA helicase
MEPRIGQLRDDLKDAVKQAQKCLKEFMVALADDNHNRFTPAKAYQDKPILGRLEKVYAPVTLDLYAMKQSLEGVFSKLDKIRKAVLEMDPSRTDFPVLHSVLDRGLETTSGLMTSLIRLTENQDPDWVYWMEGEYWNPNTSREKLILSLHASLVDVAETLNGKFFKRFDHCLLTSATLKVNQSFDYFLRRVGLDDFGHVKTQDFLSPFLYNEQVTYHQYGGAREISTDPTLIAEIVYHLHKTIGKRTMVLFTSRKALTDTANVLKDKPGGRDLPLFAQTRGASRPGIIKGMHQHPNGILFGTNSFWEGVDLPGDLLEILVLVKLPFDVPTEPLVKSYSEFVSRMGGNSFMEYTVPECAIRFRQGFGRLIRTTYDAGKFICLDNRIVTKRYGEIFARSLPVDMTTFSEMDSIR